MVQIYVQYKKAQKIPMFLLSHRADIVDQIKAS